MVISRLAPIAIVLLCCADAAAQDWREFYSKQDLFSSNFPGEPEVRTIAWQTEYGASAPARVYTVKRGQAPIR